MTRSPPTSPIIQAQAIGRIDAHRGTDLLAPTDFALCAAERVTVSGPSGAGKSVLLRALGLLDGIDAGRILWRGREVARGDVPRYRRHIAYLRQRPAMIDGSVADNLRLPYSLATYRDVRFDAASVDALLAQAGRDQDFLERDVNDLSGGEAQLVALIRVLQLAPDVLLLDEPTAALDGQSVEAVETLVAQWFEASPDTRATLWVSHDPKQTQRVGSRHMTMRDGVLTPAAASAQGQEHGSTS